MSGSDDHDVRGSRVQAGQPSKPVTAAFSCPVAVPVPVPVVPVVAVDLPWVKYRCINAIVRRPDGPGRCRIRRRVSISATGITGAFASDGVGVYPQELLRSVLGHRDHAGRHGDGVGFF